MDASALFEEVAAAHTGDADVLRAKMFGAPGLRVRGKFFACLVKGQLVLKLPVARVAALVASGTAAPFDPGMGRPMKEWVTVAPDAAPWPALAAEAKTFVAAGAA